MFFVLCIQFPKLVQTRLNGEDSQDLQPEDLISVFAANVPIPGEKVDDFLVPVARPLKRDGEAPTRKGEIKQELEEINRKHQEDIENRRREEEQRSQELILQLQVWDCLGGLSIHYPYPLLLLI